MKKFIKNIIIVVLLISIFSTIPAYASVKKNKSSKPKQAKTSTSIKKKAPAAGKIKPKPSISKSQSKKVTKISTKTPAKKTSKVSTKTQSKAPSKLNSPQGRYVYVTYKKNGKTYRKKVWQPYKNPVSANSVKDKITPTPVSPKPTTPKPSKPNPSEKPDVKPDLKTTYEVNDIKYYDITGKEIIAIPVDCKINSSDTDSAYDVTYECVKNEDKIEIVIQNTTTALNYHEYFSSLKKDVSLNNNDNNTVNVKIGTVSNVNIDVTTVNSKNYTSNGAKYRRKYIIVGISNKNIGDGSNTSSSEETSEKNKIENSADSSLSSRGEESQRKFFREKSQILITLDAGHGGSASGAVAESIMEKDLNLDITLKLKELLEDDGYVVHLTRDSDSYLSLQERSDSANIIGSNLFISIHHNASLNSLYSGTTVLYNSKALKPAFSLASILKDEVCSYLRTKPLNLQNRPEIAVLNSTYMPSVLVEVCCISNDDDLAKIIIDDNRSLAAAAILKGINKYFKFE